MKYSLKFYLDRPDSSDKSKEEKSIYYQLTWKGERLRKSTEKKCRQCDWENQRVVKKSESSLKVNPFLVDFEYKIEKFFENRASKPSPSEIEIFINGKVEENTNEFLTLFDKFIKDSETGIRLTKGGKKIKPLTIKSYKQTKSILTNFADKKKLSLSWKIIDDKFYNRFTAYMWDDLDYYDNAVGSRIRVLKTFLNWCESEKYISSNIYNDSWITWEEQIDIVVLYPDELSLLFNADAKDDRLNKTKDTFLSGCMTCLRVSNLLGLLPEEYTGSQLKVITVKGDKPLYLDVNPLLKKIFDKYEGKYNTLLPTISEQKFNDALKDLAKWFKKYLDDNQDKIKEGFVGNNWNKQFLRTRYKRGEPIRIKIDFTEMISSHTMRRTGITNLLMMGLSEIEVKEISGHSLNSKDFPKYVKIAKQFISKKSNDAWNKIASAT